MKTKYNIYIVLKKSLATLILFILFGVNIQVSFSQSNDLAVNDENVTQSYDRDYYILDTSTDKINFPVKYKSIEPIKNNQSELISENLDETLNLKDEDIYDNSVEYINNKAYKIMDFESYIILNEIVQEKINSFISNNPSLNVFDIYINYVKVKTKVNSKKVTLILKYDNNGNVKKIIKR